MAGTSKSRTAGLLAALKKPDVASSDSSAESDNGSDDSDDNLSTHRSALKPALDLTHTRSPEISLKPHSTIPFAETANDEESDDEAAYQAMKRRLLGPAKPSAPIQSTESVPRQQEAQPTAISSDEDDDMPVRAHQRVSNAKNTSNSVLCSPAGSVRSRHSSPGLFVTPSPSPAKRSSRASPGASSGADESKARKATKFQERVRRIREERLAREKEEQTQQEQQKSATKAIRRRLQQDGDDESDGENGRRLTQQAKPTRKAGKKALEAMARDQQRISRNMQLTHQAKTKKKHTVKDLFSRFGFDAPGMDITVSEPVDVAQPSSAPGSSDVDANELKDTPPTSPPSAVEETEKEITSQIETPVEPARLDKGKGRAPEFAHLPPRPWETQAEAVTMQHAQLQTQAPADIAMIDLSDSEDETTKPKSRFPVFDRLPLKKQEQSSSLLHLRHLAHLTGSDYARKGPKSVSLAEMQFSLAQKAREQAHKEREEKIAELKRRGIHIETEEEREKNQAEIEDMVAQLEKQRQEDRKLAKLEMEEAKKNGQTIDDLPSSDESDGDFVGSDEEDADEAEDEDEGEEADLELSGSEDEGEGQNNGEDVDIQNGTEPVTVVDTAAHSDTEGDAAPSATKPQSLEDADMEDIDTIAPIRKSNVVRNRKVVVDDDDDDELEVEEAQTCSPTQPATQDNAMAAFGFGGAQTSLGLTQMFAGTMANLESDSQAERTTTYETEQNSLDFLRSLPDTQPGANFSQTSDFLVPNSQTLKSPQKMSQVGPESQFSLGISQLVKTSPAFSRTQVELEDFPEPTQDAGFSFSRSPVGLKPPPPSTVDTVMLAALESPVKQRKGKLQRGRKDAVTELSDVDDEVIAEPEADFSDEDDIQRPPKPRDAFAKLARGAKKTKAMDDFNKKTSMAKGAVMEQAEESEDEYAGIGGASDDESGEEDEEINKMIDHGEVDVDERQLAAFYASVSTSFIYSQMV